MGINITFPQGQEPGNYLDVLQGGRFVQRPDISSQVGLESHSLLQNEAILTFKGCVCVVGGRGRYKHRHVTCGALVCDSGEPVLSPRPFQGAMAQGHQSYMPRA